MRGIGLGAGNGHAAAVGVKYDRIFLGVRNRVGREFTQICRNGVLFRVDRHILAVFVGNLHNLIYLRPVITEYGVAVFPPQILRQMEHHCDKRNAVLAFVYYRDFFLLPVVYSFKNIRVHDNALDHAVVRDGGFYFPGVGGAFVFLHLQFYQNMGICAGCANGLGNVIQAAGLHVWCFFTLGGHDAVVYAARQTHVLCNGMVDNIHHYGGRDGMLSRLGGNHQIIDSSRNVLHDIFIRIRIAGHDGIVFHAVPNQIGCGFLARTSDFAADVKGRFIFVLYDNFPYTPAAIPYIGLRCGAILGFLHGKPVSVLEPGHTKAWNLRKAIFVSGQGKVP